ncbi:hypothetical protein [Acinetobacter nematophilus]|uniref:Uncharacterized protein n=1 Tax=Acinetobacter nematophilus TaxID=2994642 RepID=A0A9X3DWL0_9GAMM|nr:hypothetical protein [Acinetobacter nematophilus]MCX5469648.1 hypothetical protein [Acinetobacter nematophilus]
MDEVSDIELQTGQDIKMKWPNRFKNRKNDSDRPFANQSSDFENFIYL